jgi:hypothetical protein
MAGHKAPKLLSLLAFAGVLAVAACGEAAAPEPPKPPYLAIVSFFDTPPTSQEDTAFGYRVEDLVVPGRVDTTIMASPADTIILPLEASTYRVTLLGLPARCEARAGTVQQVLLLEQYNTGIARYQVSCTPSLAFAVYSYGTNPDLAFTWHLTGPTPLSGVVNQNDSILLSPLAPGRYTLSLAHVAANCVVISDGGMDQVFDVDSMGGGPFRAFNVSCVDETIQPRIVSLRGSYHDDAIGFVIKAVDPDRDIRRFWWDVTDCAGESVRPGGGTERSNLASERTGVDTTVILHAFELGLPEADLQGRCVAARVMDERGNTSAVVETPLGGTGTKPDAFLANSYVVGQTQIRTEIRANDVDGDLLGAFLSGRVRDGILSPPDGRDDFLLRNVEGYLGVVVPDFPVGPPYPGPEDVNAMMIYVLDAAGNFSRYVDTDTFQ